MTWLLNKLFSLTWIGDIVDNINGSKTMIGLATLVIHVLGIIPAVFPDIGLPSDIALTIDAWLKYIGVALLPVGAAHKVTKKMAGE